MEYVDYTDTQLKKIKVLRSAVSACRKAGLRIIGNFEFDYGHLEIIPEGDFDGCDDLNKIQGAERIELDSAYNMPIVNRFSNTFNTAA